MLVRRPGLPQADRQLILSALRHGPPTLPTDMPDLAPLIDACAAAAGRESVA